MSTTSCEQQQASQSSLPVSSIQKAFAAMGSTSQEDEYFQKMIEQNLSLWLQSSGGDTSLSQDFTLSQLEGGTSQSQQSLVSIATTTPAATSLSRQSSVASTTQGTTTNNGNNNCYSTSLPSLWNSHSDFFRSVDSFIAKFQSTESYQSISDMYGNNVEALRDMLVNKSIVQDNKLSQDWAPEYEGAHVEVNPKNVFSSQQQLSQLSQDDVIYPASQESVATTTSKWEAMYYSNLPTADDDGPKIEPASSSSSGSSPKDAAADAKGAAAMHHHHHPPTIKLEDMPFSEQDAAEALTAVGSATGSLPLPTLASSGATTITATTTRSATLNQMSSFDRKHRGTNGGNSSKGKHSGNKRKRDPDQKQYYEPDDDDVLCGRGGRTNHHAGNKEYLRLKEDIQKRYLKASKTEKTDISQELVDAIHSRGGRFLEQEPHTGRWYEITQLKARKKASQTLREINTPEERKAKRERYGK